MNTSKKSISLDSKKYNYYDIKSLFTQESDIGKLPFAIRILLENALRQLNGVSITQSHIEAILNWQETQGKAEIPYIPSRIILQDFTGVPAVVDLAVMRDTVAKAGVDPSAINPKVPVDLVIDHSVMVDFYGSDKALEQNVDKEFKRNKERYEFLKWATGSFENFRAVPPSTGIIHQVNLEYLASVAMTKEVDGETLVYPDTLVGTDSHTTMINSLGVLGWGVGGIEAEACMLGQPLYFIIPEVVGLELAGTLPEGANATDLALTVTELLRKEKVVGKFVEFFGDGLKNLSLQDRSTVSNMAPEYGATMGYFPVDDVTIDYLGETGRTKEQVALTQTYYKTNGLYREADSVTPTYTKVVKLDLATVTGSLAGPKRPQDRIDLNQLKSSFEADAVKAISEGGFGVPSLEDVYKLTIDNNENTLGHGSVVLAAITSCTNTSNPTVMIGAGLIAKKAVDLGLKVKDYVKTSLTPGSKVVTRYLEEADVLTSLETLGFHIVGYGCATCIGNSGPLNPAIAKVIDDNDLTVSSVLSGNRNFEGRIHSKIKANYLASPMLVVAYALAGTVRIDFEKDPLGHDQSGNPIYLRDIWPSSIELSQVVNASQNKDQYLSTYAEVFEGSKKWQEIDTKTSSQYDWDSKSTYVQAPPFFEGLVERSKDIVDIKEANILALLKDSVTTDHISPAGSISNGSPAAKYLVDNNVEVASFNSFGSRRGNHEVMMRGTFGNIRIRNIMAEGKEGGYTKYIETGEIMPIYDASMKYQEQNRNLVILAGKEYGTGSSRDWAAKGTQLLGVKAVVAESYERIHRSNLVGMGVLPLQFLDGKSWADYGITGNETIDILGLNNDLKPGEILKLVIDGSKEIEVVCRIDSDMEVTYYRNGGILHTVLLDMME